MTPVVVRALKKYISSRIANLSTLFISWFGGEPLLAQDTIEEISEYVNSLLRKYMEVDYRADITTNAYLLEMPVFNRFSELRIDHYQITFDGPREHHDRKRVLAGGEGTFDRIWSHLLDMRGSDREFSVDVRLHLDRENSPQIGDFVKQYEAAFKNDGRFRLFVRPLSCLGGKNDNWLEILNEAEAKAKMDELERYMREHGINYKVIDGTRRQRQVCCASKLNSFIVRSNGDINKCSVALESALNHVGRLNEDGTITVDVEKMRYWARGLESGDVEELTCPLRNLA